MKKKDGLLYSRKEEILNVTSHAMGLVLTVATAILFIPLCVKANNVAALLGTILYLCGMGASYFTSTLYHALKHHNPLKSIIRHWDHAAIYWHIAGSYSPICLVTLYHYGNWGLGLFVFVWLSALIGSLVSFRKMEVHSHVETICFIAMGLSIVVAIKPLLVCIPTIHVILWVVLEGIFYIVGALFYSLHKRRYMHSIFHLFVLLGSVSHIMAVKLILENM